MTAEIKFQLFCVTGPGTGYQIGQLFDSEMAAKNHALRIKKDEDQEYKIIVIITNRTTLDIFTVPAHVPTLEEIAQEIIDGSDGSFHMEWGEAFEQLEEPARSQVEERVWEEISSCDCCGWHFHVDHLERIDGDMVCWKCEDDIRAAEYEEGEEDAD